MELIHSIASSSEQNKLDESKKTFLLCRCQSKTSRTDPKLRRI